MIGSFVMTENELLKKKPTPDSVGMGSYTIDSHNVQRYITPDGYVQNEGDIGVPLSGPYEIAYGSLVPKRGEADNLLVPVAMSASHIAYGSIRMEPVFMILGQSAATAAVMAIDAKQAVQDVPYAKLRERLLADGQILEYAAPAHGGAGGHDPAKLPGVVIDDAAAKVTGDWKESTVNKPFVGDGYRHEDNSRDGKATARFEAKLPKAGRYEVRLAYPPNTNRATNVPVVVHHATGAATVTLNQREDPRLDDGCSSAWERSTSPWTKLPSSRSRNASTDGYVIIDAVQWLSK